MLSVPWARLLLQQQLAVLDVREVDAAGSARRQRGGPHDAADLGQNGATPAPGRLGRRFPSFVLIRQPCPSSPLRTLTPAAARRRAGRRGGGRDQVANGRDQDVDSGRGTGRSCVGPFPPRDGPFPAGRYAGRGGLSLTTSRRARRRRTGGGGSHSECTPRVSAVRSDELLPRLSRHCCSSDDGG